MFWDARHEQKTQIGLWGHGSALPRAHSESDDWPVQTRLAVNSIRDTCIPRGCISEMHAFLLLIHFIVFFSTIETAALPCSVHNYYTNRLIYVYLTIEGDRWKCRLDRTQHWWRHHVDWRHGHGFADQQPGAGTHQKRRKSAAVIRTVCAFMIVRHLRRYGCIR